VTAGFSLGSFTSWPWPDRCSVSSSRPSNRACGSPAHGLPTPFTAGIRLLPPGLVGPGCHNGSVQTHRPARAPQDVSAQDLVPQRMNRCPGSALAVRYSVCCRARTLSNGTLSATALPLSAGLAEMALTGHLHSHPHASTKQWPFPHRRLCCPLGSISTMATSDAHPAGFHFPAPHRL